MRRLLPVLASMLAIAGCSETPPVVPAPAPPRPVPVPSPTLAPPPPRAADWRDWPLTPGDWVYRQDARGSIALFGQPGAEAELTLRCDLGRGRIVLSRRGEGAGAISLRTTSALRSLAVQPVSTGTATWLAADLSPRDPAIDAMGFSRGRFVIEGAGLPGLVVPAYAEILRVAEDCR
jgi:hypothetical protein